MAVAPDRRRASQVEPLAGPENELAADLFAEHSRRIYAYCLGQLRSPEEAEDALQLTYLNACRSLMRGFEPETAQAWLFKVAQNVCLTKRRSFVRRARVEQPRDLQEVEHLLPAPAPAGDDLLGIEDALAALPEQQRRAILLREWQGLSYREVARELGLSQSAVEALIFRARRSLAAALTVAGEPAPRPSRRLLRAFDPGALLAALKAGISTSASSGVAAGLAVAASATLLVADPVGRTFEPLRPSARQPAPQVARTSLARAATLAAPNGDIRLVLRGSAADRGGRALGHAQSGKESWVKSNPAGVPKGKARGLRLKPAKSNGPPSSTPSAQSSRSEDVSNAGGNDKGQGQPKGKAESRGSGKE